MYYQSTRGKVSDLGFFDAFMMGLADDGGLLVPDEIPALQPDTLQAWRKLDYRELAFAVFQYFVNGELSETELRRLIADGYAGFRDPEVTPVRKLNDSLHILELFHGPTFAFKDIALQLMGQLYEHVAVNRKVNINILGATSGDTGASAIEGVRGKEGINICILHPRGKVSKVQELQMTTVPDANVLNLAVDGNFDDCQRIIKDLFADLEFKQNNQLAAINSINFIRIMAQTVYYFYAYFRVTDERPGAKVNFSVPTGNFGDIFAGYLAKRMGLPVHKLILATNENNILERFIETGVYKPGNFRMTYSPSMDIQVASNFERYLYYVLDERADDVRTLMERFRTEGELAVGPEVLAQVRKDFAAYSVNGEECLQTISRYHAESGYLLDPHTACGVAAAEKRSGPDELTVALATAHPAKFDEAIRLCGIRQTFPEPIAALFNKPQRMTNVAADADAVAKELERFYHR